MNMDDTEHRRENRTSSDDLIGRAIEAAGPRTAPPPEARALLEGAVRAAWQAKVAEQSTVRRRQLRSRVLTLAAILLIAAGLSYLLLPQALSPFGSGPPPLAIVEAGSSTGHPIGTEINLGATVETTAGERLALRLADGTSLRFDTETRLTLHQAERFTLHQGAVYLDTGPGAHTVAVETPYGTARDIGTQFEVRLTNNGLRVAVREGKVHLERPEGTHEAPTGTALTVAPSGQVERTPISPHGTEWSWVLTTAPPFDLEGSSMWEFIGWVTRETGWQLDTSDPQLERRLKGIMAHGSVEGLRPDEALEVVVPSAGLEYEVQDGVLVLQ